MRDVRWLLVLLVVVAVLAQAHHQSRSVPRPAPVEVDDTEHTLTAMDPGDTFWVQVQNDEATDRLDCRLQFRISYNGRTFQDFYTRQFAWPGRQTVSNWAVSLPPGTRVVQVAAVGSHADVSLTVSNGWREYRERL